MIKQTEGVIHANRELGSLEFYANDQVYKIHKNQTHAIKEDGDLVTITLIEPIRIFKLAEPNNPEKQFGNIASIEFRTNEAMKQDFINQFVSVCSYYFFIGLSFLSYIRK